MRFATYGRKSVYSDKSDSVGLNITLKINRKDYNYGNCN